jgi:putative oxidoreductase
MAIANLTLLGLRLAVGLTFAGHGAQKAFGWWNGPGLEGWRKAIAGMRFQPVFLWALVSIAVELVGGLMLAIGLLTPLAATALIGQSVVIIFKVHLPNGFWNAQRGIEFPLALAAGTFAILGVGPGSISIDRAIGFALGEPALWLLLLLGLVGGSVAYALSRLAPAAQTAAEHR